MKIMIVFQCLLEPQKIDFWTNMAPAWPDFGSQDGPKLVPKWGQSRPQNGLGSDVGSRADSGSILGRFWVDLGSILSRFWADFWSNLGRFLVDFGTIFGWVNIRF